MLVVIAIIAILAAILFPVFAKAREKARQASCASNEKQIGLGIIQYVQDNDETFPEQYVTVLPNYYAWQYAIYPYVKSTGVYQCPDNTTVPAASGTTGLTAGGGVTVSAAYGLNDTGSRNGPTAYGIPTGATGGGDGSAGITLAKIQQASSFIMVSEDDPKNGYGTEDVLNTNTPAAPVTGANGNGIYAGHTSFSNYLFSDGHVKAMRPFATLDTTAAGCSGSGTVNMWTYDSSDFSAANCTLANANLAVAVNAYK